MNNKYELLTLGVHPVAMSLLHLIVARLPDPSVPQTEISATVFHNGREHGIVLECGKFFKEKTFIVFGECRNSDSIFVDTWKGEGGMNPATLADFPEEVYQNRSYFNGDSKLVNACDVVLALISNRWSIEMIGPGPLPKKSTR